MWAPVKFSHVFTTSTLIFYIGKQVSYYSSVYSNILNTELMPERLTQDFKTLLITYIALHLQYVYCSQVGNHNPMEGHTYFLFSLNKDTSLSEDNFYTNRGLVNFRLGCQIFIKKK